MHTFAAAPAVASGDAAAAGAGSSLESSGEGSDDGSSLSACSGTTLPAAASDEDDEGVIPLGAGRCARGSIPRAIAGLSRVQTNGAAEGRAVYGCGMRSFHAAAAAWAEKETNVKQVVAEAGRDVGGRDQGGTGAEEAPRLRGPAPGAPTGAGASAGGDVRGGDKVSLSAGAQYREEHGIQMVVPRGMAAPEPCATFDDVPFPAMVKQMVGGEVKGRGVGVFGGRGVGEGRG